MDADVAARSLEAVRATAPLVHNVTNGVAMALSANLLIAAGASPIMAMAPEEAGDIAAVSGALVVNMGTLTAAWIEGAEAAIGGAERGGKPWLLDPVGVGATAFRRSVGARLLGRRPTVVRGNASEIAALAGEVAGGKGVDSTLGSDAVLGVARELARQSGSVVVVTGEVDLVSDGDRLVRVRNGHPLLTRITASGCGLSALTGAWLAVSADPVEACAGALAAYGIAAELAAERSRGPGSFQVELLDALAALDGETVRWRARIA